jgi:predicted short-subunit dehydrogenase-like oxidoreductase (DUF2520 family)
MSASSADEPAPAGPSVFVIGAGVVGTTLAASLRAAGVPVLGLHGRSTVAAPAPAPGAGMGLLATSGELPEVMRRADVVILCVRDDRIAQVAERLRREARLGDHHILLHTSGAHAAAEVLGAARAAARAIGTMHPLVSFADPGLFARGLREVAFGVEGDSTARAAARLLVGKLGGRALDLAAGDLALYHAAAVLASNYVVALADLARGLFIQAGVPPEDALPALVPLMSSVVQNLAQVGLPGALTGPVERGDVSTVERHLETLEQRAPELAPLYRSLGREVLRIARGKSPLEAEAAARLAALLGGGGSG